MKTFLISTSLALICALPSFAERIEFDSVAATVNGRPIMWSQVRNAVGTQLEQLHDHHRQLSPIEYAKQLDDLLNRGRDALIDRELILDHFESTPHKISDVYVDAEVQNRIQAQFEGDRAKFRAYLETIGLSYNQFRDFIRDEMIIVALRRQEAAAPVFLTPKEVEKVYLANIDRFTIKGNVAVRTITIPKSTAEATEAQQRAKVAEIRQQLLDGGDFALQARLHSSDSAARDGGLRDPMAQAELAKPLQSPAFDLPIGKVSTVIEIGDFLTLLRVEHRSPDQVAALTEVRPQVEMLAMQQKRAAAIEEWLGRLRRVAEIHRKTPG